MLLLTQATTLVAHTCVLKQLGHKLHFHICLLDSCQVSGQRSGMISNYARPIIQMTLTQFI